MSINDPGIMTNPEKVATDYPVHSAVFFWNKRAINALADQDDLEKVTRRVNGGLNGLNERREFLIKAKPLFGLTP